MAVSQFGLYKHVVYVHLDVASDLIFKDLGHETLICGPSVLEAERHDL